MIDRLLSGRSSPAGRTALLATLLCAAAAAPGALAGQVPDTASRTAADRAARGEQRELARRLDRLLADPSLSRAHVGLQVTVAETGEVLYERDAEERYTAASTTKAVTAAVALRRLGPGFRWTTRLLGAEPIRDGVLRGDLWIVGSGDPYLGRGDLARWASALRDAGLRRITGDVVADDRVFPPPRWGDGWMWNDLHLGWAAGVTGLQLDEPGIRMALAPGDALGDPARAGPTEPPVPAPVELRVRTGPPGSAIRLDFIPGSRPGARGRIEGWIPADSDSIPLSLAPAHPTRHLLGRLAAVFADSALTVEGRFRRAEPGETAPGSTRSAAGRRAAGADGRRDTGDLGSTRDPPFRAAFRSDSLGAVLADILQPSDNLAAESLLRTLGRVEGTAGTAGEGLEVVRETLAEWGVPPDAVVLADGSGLSRYDAIAPSALVRVLRAVWWSPRHELFRSALAAPGEEGTLRARLVGTPAEAALRAKTGSLSSVRGLAGYVEDGDGETLVFALLIDGYHVPGDVAESLRDRVVEQLSLFHRPVEPGWPAFREAGGGPDADEGG